MTSTHVCDDAIHSGQQSAYFPLECIIYTLPQHNRHLRLGNADVLIQQNAAAGDDRKLSDAEVAECADVSLPFTHDTQYREHDLQVNQNRGE